MILTTIHSFFRDYKFIKRDCEIEVWVEKFAACYDTGMRLSLIMAYEKNSERNFINAVQLIEENTFRRKH